MKSIILILNRSKILGFFAEIPQARWGTLAYRANYIHFNSEAILKPFLHTYA